MQEASPLHLPSPRPSPGEGAALVLPGGEARTAYQAGVLQGLANLLQQQGWPAERNPFPVVCGTSAGAINAAHYASGVATWADTLQALPGIWASLHADQVFHTQPHYLLRGELRWLGLMSTGWLVRQSPRALQPFREFPVLLITPSESINAIAALEPHAARHARAHGRHRRGRGHGRGARQLSAVRARLLHRTDATGRA
ncbi:hypothetical protein THIX_10525 [Thiomonas sp. X19]|uniref:patatin-like phospholipase family protein n=1 Tax=Thiomonas sp. X19 TaxID=1050370 RepID=UPI000B65D1FB|nr:patatin-like phospholipase family protein [Thiomonas sp. X19]SCC91484.1 hypothetical protein THIX_10525 [Thiomonas sp. X19]